MRALLPSRQHRQEQAYPLSEKEESNLKLPEIKIATTYPLEDVSLVCPW